PASSLPKVVARELLLNFPSFLYERIAGQPITRCQLAEGNIVMWSFSQDEVIRGMLHGISGLIVALFAWSVFELVRYGRDRRIPRHHEPVAWPDPDLCAHFTIFEPHPPRRCYRHRVFRHCFNSFDFPDDNRKPCDEV